MAAPATGPQSKDAQVTKTDVAEARFDQLIRKLRGITV